MKKISALFLILLLFFNCSNESVETQEEQEEQFCDNGTFIGNVTLATQQEVDEFGAMCYTKVDGMLTIGQDFLDNDIMDLTPLNSLTEIYVSSADNPLSGRLRILASNLTSLSGLENVESVNGLAIRRCYQLENLIGLSGLINIGGTDNNWQSLEINHNSSLQTLDGIENLSNIGTIGTIGFVQIGNNPQLVNIDGLSGINAVYGQIKTSVWVNCGPSCTPAFETGNSSLMDLCGFQNLFTNGTYGDVHIDYNAYNPTVQDIIDGNCSQ